MVAVSGQGFSVHPPTLVQSGQNAEAVGDHLASVAELISETSQAVAAHQGWLSSSAAQACVTAWRAQTKTLASEIRALSDSLQASAQHYDKIEQKILQDLNDVADGLPLQQGH